MTETIILCVACLVIGYMIGSNVMYWTGCRELENHIGECHSVMGQMLRQCDRMQTALSYTRLRDKLRAARKKRK